MFFNFILLAKCLKNKLPFALSFLMDGVQLYKLTAKNNYYNLIINLLLIFIYLHILSVSKG